MVFQQLWRELIAVWAPEGTIADPNGSPSSEEGEEGEPGAPQATGDEGTIADPNG
jgi:hypothetical protein